MILVVSDVHLGYKRCNEEAFNKFLDKYVQKDIEHLVLLGDIFDFWRRSNSKIAEEYREILEKLCSFNAGKVHYVVGNHDYYMLKLKGRYGNHPFKVSKSLRLRDGGKNFYFIHGYEFEVLIFESLTLDVYEAFSEKMCYGKNVIGSVASPFWEFFYKNKSGIAKLMCKMKKNPQIRLEEKLEFKGEEKKEKDIIHEFAVSQGKRFLLGMKPYERLVFGHTHMPFINREGTVVNTGSWVDELKSKQYQNSYVEILDGHMKLKFFRP